MERMLKKIFSMALLVSATAMADNCCNTCNNCCEVSPYIYNRSVSVNAARELAGWTGHVNLADMDRHYGSLSFTPEYTRSFYPGKIANRLFNCDLVSNPCGTAVTNNNNCCCNPCGCGIKIAGADTAADGKTWLADYFYLPTSYVGGFTVKPVIQNALLDMNLYWGMDEWANGLYFRIHAPITWTKWDLGMCMCGEVPGDKAGFDGLPTPLKSFQNFSCNSQKPADFTVTPEGGQPYTVKSTPLYYSRLCSCSEHKTALADIQADFGWNFLNDDDYHLGLFLRAAAPTGNRPHGQLLFEPIVGNGKHWELGGGLTSHAILWRSEEKEDKHFGFYVDANITHLFNAKQCRFFDLCGKGAWSRYILAAKDTADGGLLYSPVANLTAHEVKVSAAVQADVAAMFNYTSGNFGWDFGYNFWGKTCDKFDCKSCDSCCTTACSTSNCCNTNSCSICECPTFYNELDGKTWWLVGQDIHGCNTTESDYLKQSDVDMDGARTKGLSHKLFMHFAYNWNDNEDYIPYLGIGGEVEFGGGKDCCKDNCCTTSTAACPTTPNTTCTTNKCCGCNNTAISQWGLWLKGGFSF